MKKRLGVGLLLIMVMVLFCSCKDESSNQDYEGLIGEAKEEINTLSAKIDQLEASLSDVTDRMETSFGDDRNGTDNTTSPAPTSNADATILPEDYNGYKKQADQLKDAIETNKSKDNSKFHEYKKALISLDNELDLCEEQLENAYDSGNLTWDQYKKRNNQLDDIETTLDRAEDLLEKQFNVDDID